MPEIVSDTNQVFETPLAAANQVYLNQSDPGFGAAFGASVATNEARFGLGQASERGAVAGSTAFEQAAAQLAAQGGDPEEQFRTLREPIQSPAISPEEANEKYAPRDPTGKIIPFADKPMPEALAQIIGQQKSDAIERQSVLARFAANRSWLTTFATGALASQLDPLQLALNFVPLVGEGAILARVGEGLVGRTVARLGAGAITGAGVGAFQAGVSALAALDPDAGSDYGMRDALRDILYNAAGMAAFHAGFGAIGDVARWLRPPAEPGAPALPPARGLDATTQNAVMRSTIGPMVEGRSPDLGVFFPERPIPPPVAPSLVTGADLGPRVPAMPDHRVATGVGDAIEVRPVVVEAANLVTSADQGFDPALQPRQRERFAAGQQVREMAGRLDPERLGVSSEADRGAPIVGPDRMVESGNGRVMAIREAYARGGAMAENYRNWVASQGVDISQFREPVLVRQRLTPLDQEGRARFTLAANQPATLTMSASERAMADARSLTSDRLELIRNPDDLGAVANRDFVRSFVQSLPQVEQGAMIGPDGTLSAQGLTRLRSAVLAAAYGDNGVLARVTEATSDEIKSISNALVAASPIWARLRADIARGAVRADVDMTDALLDAVRRTADLRTARISLADHLKQIDAFDQLPGPVEGWMRIFYDPAGRRAISTERITAALRFYAEEARKVSAERGLALGIPEVGAADIQRLAAERARSGVIEPTLQLGGAGAGVGPGRPEGGSAIRRPGPSLGGPTAGTAAADRIDLSIRQLAEARDGWASGVSSQELAADTDAVYGKGEPVVSREAPPPGEAAPEAALLEQQIANLPPEALHPDDRAELAQADEAITKATTMRSVFETAASCLMGLGA